MREEIRRTQEEFQALKDGIQIYQKHHKKCYKKEMSNYYITYDLFKRLNN